MVILNDKFKKARNTVNTHKSNLVKIEEENRNLLSLLMISDISIQEFKDRISMNNIKIEKSKVALREAIDQLGEINTDINKSKIKAV